MLILLLWAIILIPLLGKGDSDIPPDLSFHPQVIEFDAVLCVPSFAEFTAINNRNESLELVRFFPTDTRFAVLTQQQSIPPRAIWHVRVVFIARSEEPVRAALRIESSVGRFLLQLRARASDAPYGIVPQRLDSVASGGSFPLIALTLVNPHREPLHVLEIFTRDDFVGLHGLPLKTPSEYGGGVLWSLEELSDKVVVSYSLDTSLSLGRHESRIFIETDHDQLVVPVVFNITEPFLSLEGRGLDFSGSTSSARASLPVVLTNAFEEDFSPAAAQLSPPSTLFELRLRERAEGAALPRAQSAISPSRTALGELSLSLLLPTSYSGSLLLSFVGVSNNSLALNVSVPVRASVVRNEVRLGERDSVIVIADSAERETTTSAALSNWLLRPALLTNVRLSSCSDMLSIDWRSAPAVHGGSWPPLSLSVRSPSVPRTCWLEVSTNVSLSPQRLPLFLSQGRLDVDLIEAARVRPDGDDFYVHLDPHETSNASRNLRFVVSNRNLFANSLNIEGCVAESVLHCASVRLRLLAAWPLGRNARARGRDLLSRHFSPSDECATADASFPIVVPAGHAALLSLHGTHSSKARYALASLGQRFVVDVEQPQNISSSVDCSVSVSTLLVGKAPSVVIRIPRQAGKENASFSSPTTVIQSARTRGMHYELTVRAPLSCLFSTERERDAVPLSWRCAAELLRGDELERASAMWSSFNSSEGADVSNIFSAAAVLASEWETKLRTISLFLGDVFVRAAGSTRFLSLPTATVNLPLGADAALSLDIPHVSVAVVQLELFNPFAEEISVSLVVPLSRQLILSAAALSRCAPLQNASFSSKETSVLRGLSMRSAHCDTHVDDISRSLNSSQMTTMEFHLFPQEKALSPPLLVILDEDLHILGRNSLSGVERLSVSFVLRPTEISLDVSDKKLVISNRGLFPTLISNVELGSLGCRDRDWRGKERCAMPVLLECGSSLSVSLARLTSCASHGSFSLRIEESDMDPVFPSSSSFPVTASLHISGDHCLQSSTWNFFFLFISLLWCSSACIALISHRELITHGLRVPTPPVRQSYKLPFLCAPKLVTDVIEETTQRNERRLNTPKHGRSRSKLCLFVTLDEPADSAQEDDAPSQPCASSLDVVTTVEIEHPLKLSDSPSIFKLPSVVQLDTEQEPVRSDSFLLEESISMINDEVFASIDRVLQPQNSPSWLVRSFWEDDEVENDPILNPSRHAMLNQRIDRLSLSCPETRGIDDLLAEIECETSSDATQPFLGVLRAAATSDNESEQWLLMNSSRRRNEELFFGDGNFFGQSTVLTDIILESEE